MDERFPKTLRLRKRAEYLDVQQLGRKLQSDFFFLLALPRTPTRVGITVSRKVGNAVVRNRLKRWVREYVRRHREALPQGELVIIAKTAARDAPHDAIDHDLGRLLGRTRTLR